MKKDYLSIAIIAKNEEKHILQTLKGIATQSYWKENYEVIIVDGNSTDNTVNFAHAYLLEQGINHKIINEKFYKNKWWWVNYWPTFARNISIDVVSPLSQYLVQIDADCRADEYRLENLRKAMKAWEKNPKLVGVWWIKEVETKWDISTFELMLNYYFCHKITRIWDSSYDKYEDNKYVSSITWYNSIFKIEILKKYGYNTTYPDFFDDKELCYRLTKDWYQLWYCPTAKIFHRLEESFGSFLKHIANYAKWEARIVKFYHLIPRLYPCLCIGYVLYTLLLLPLCLWNWCFILPYLIIFILSCIVFFNNIKKTKSLISLYVYPLLFLHPFMYGWWFLIEFIEALFKK